MSPLLIALRAIALDDTALVIGALLVIAGCFVLAPWVGLIVAGLAFIGAGWFVVGGEE